MCCVSQLLLRRRPLRLRMIRVEVCVCCFVLHFNGELRFLCLYVRKERHYNIINTCWRLCGCSSRRSSVPVGLRGQWGGTGTGTTVATPARAPTSRITTRAIAAQTQPVVAKSWTKQHAVNAVPFYISDSSLVLSRAKHHHSSRYN